MRVAGVTGVLIFEEGSFAGGTRVVETKFDFAHVFVVKRNITRMYN